MMYVRSTPKGQVSAAEEDITTDIELISTPICHPHITSVGSETVASFDISVHLSLDVKAERRTTYRPDGPRVRIIAVHSKNKAAT